MNRSTIVLCLSLFLMTVPAASAAIGDTVAEGHIQAGGPHTALLSVGEATGEEGVDSFFFAAPAEGTVVTTETVNNTDIPYDLDIYWFAEDGSYLSSCATEAADETCAVPAGAAEGEVAAWLGADLDVTVLEA